jgi:ribosomal-protein-alanine N-acetyltransferase
MHVDSPQYGVIRQFQRSDINRVLEIASHSLTEYYTSSLIFDLYESWPEGFTVYTVDNEIVAFMIAARNTPNEARILMFAVDEDHRRQGIGEKLMQEFVIFASMNGFISLKLEVKTDNDSAINFYKKFGFVITSRLRAYYSDASDAFTMWKII